MLEVQGSVPRPDITPRSSKSPSLRKVPENLRGMLMMMLRTIPELMPFGRSGLFAAGHALESQAFQLELSDPDLSIKECPQIIRKDPYMIILTRK